MHECRNTIYVNGFAYKRAEKYLDERKVENSYEVFGADAEDVDE